MGPLAQFLLALTNLVRSGAIRKIPQAMKFAEQQFGKVTPLLKKQIEKVFESVKKPAIGKPGKKEGTVLPFIKGRTVPSFLPGLPIAGFLTDSKTFSICFFKSGVTFPNCCSANFIA